MNGSPAYVEDSRYHISPRSLPKQKFTKEDDVRLIAIVNRLGTKSWSEIANEMGDRNQRQCKERWENYLSPDINRNEWTPEEDALLIEKQKEIGSRWISIARFFDRRTDAAVKNRWQMLDRKQRKLEKKGLHTQKKQKAVIESPIMSTPTTTPIMTPLESVAVQPVQQTIIDEFPVSFDLLNFSSNDQLPVIQNEIPELDSFGTAEDPWDFASLEEVF
ncbi:Myb-like DNA-binding domain containing protein [Trichomonas vaginalis G3]|uniref:Myb-like DNA-binding domain containing protein n=1 Tax=Trichomonas vaginalis (strain ATCC PRA-98 / G3) TaxID=412133 RepID=A2FRX1_TRIV3|nr:RNA polymerase II transcription regulator recruiting protein [Trichomonas vaginalis G3]EAX92337.1 Myb-like DNA-binding domain containing protein [Trichomonas vaginalis G3]KAI5506411.1 RNA polymerase II transcription regulator recruiting protein [Trichomonas vaginalis G3]|eukprot:XP_001305267.1 Myb-like DNA-binding domain containing protein [Trichomonas vaginalis G3]